MLCDAQTQDATAKPPPPTKKSQKAKGSRELAALGVPSHREADLEDAGAGALATRQTQSKATRASLRSGRSRT
ncbi:hypothetical protein WJX84_002520 [Apatococcus fuscideae]|uniref:Uncharacterized protein n=1 Tax=Apatococcus fuscideae TaxID=2026836 RepID=A0AAW1SMZ0_9CHLO